MRMSTCGQLGAPAWQSMSAQVQAQLRNVREKKTMTATEKMNDTMNFEACNAERQPLLALDACIPVCINLFTPFNTLFRALSLLWSTVSL